MYVTEALQHYFYVTVFNSSAIIVVSWTTILNLPNQLLRIILDLFMFLFMKGVCWAAASIPGALFSSVTDREYVQLYILYMYKVSLNDKVF